MTSPPTPDTLTAIAAQIDTGEPIAAATARILLDEVITLRSTLADADAEALVNEAKIRELSIRDGAVVLDVVPPHELAVLWVHCARGMLGDAPNYSETVVGLPAGDLEDPPGGTVSMTVKAAGEYENFIREIADLQARIDANEVVS